MKSAIIIGSGFAGLSAASFLAKAGWRVTVLEKHGKPGGRARQLREDGFTFDMGPSWYWMPDVFERYFAQFGKKVSDYYSLHRLDPSYRVYWADSITDIPAAGASVDGPADITAFRNMLDTWEPGAGEKLEAFLKEAAYKYKTGIGSLVFKPGRSVAEFADWQVIRGVFRLDIFSSIRKHIQKYFRHPRIRQLLEFPVLFLGALPENTPALYSLMNYADIVGGTWYPQGGMYSVVDGMYRLAKELGVEFRFGENVTHIDIVSSTAKKVNGYLADIVIGNADYHFIESTLLPAAYRSYTESYWEKRLMAPSCLLYYVGIKKRLKNIRHHMLIFDRSFEEHAREIYVTRQWPQEPLFYVSASSVTDQTVAPEGCENLVFLVPIAAGLEDDTETLRNHYFDQILKRFEKHIGEPIADFIIYKQSFSASDFVHEYNSFKGNAYGLANTLMQTAIFRPSCRSKKVRNLFYTGQLTVPGPGVPPALISGEVVAAEVLKYF